MATAHPQFASNEWCRFASTDVTAGRPEYDRPDYDAEDAAVKRVQRILHGCSSWDQASAALSSAASESPGAATRAFIRRASGCAASKARERNESVGQTAELRI